MTAGCSSAWNQEPRNNLQSRADGLGLGLYRLVSYGKGKARQGKAGQGLPSRLQLQLQSQSQSQSQSQVLGRRLQVAAEGRRGTWAK